MKCLRKINLIAGKSLAVTLPILFCEKIGINRDSSVVVELNKRERAIIIKRAKSRK